MAISGVRVQAPILHPNPPKTWWILLSSAQFQYQMVASLWGRSNGGILYLKVARNLGVWELGGARMVEKRRKKMK